MADTNGAKAFGGMAALAAIGTFTWMLWQAQDSKNELLVERIDELRNDIAEVNRLLEKHADSEGHPKLSQRVKSLENNGVTLRHQDRMIRMLWQRSYDEAMPEVNGSH